MLITLFITCILAWLHGITKEQWLHALDLAHEAEVELTGNDSGAAKKAWVLTRIQARWPALKALALNLLVELAASAIKRA